MSDKAEKTMQWVLLGWGGLVAAGIFVAAFLIWAARGK